MKFSRFFIDHPVFASALSILIVIIGAVSLISLPITEYPNFTPPQIVVEIMYPGATAAVMEQAVAIPVEEAVNGAQNMIYMSSRSANDGSYTLKCTFKPGTNPSVAAVEVQNRVSQAEGDLPSAVLQEGIIVKKRSPTTLMIVSLYSPDGAYDDLFVSDYAQIHVIDPVARVTGIGDYSQHGHTYAMRVWVDPNRMAELSVTADDLKRAIQAQNVRTPTGQIGSPPSAPDTPYEYNVVANTQITEPREYDNIIVRQQPDGSILRIRDIGHSELGGQNYNTFTRLNGQPASSVMLYQIPSANAIETERKVKATMEHLKKYFPPGLDYAITMDSTDFIVASMKEVLKTFLIALALVFAVVYLFLGTLRATLIPMLAVPVSLIGSFGAFVALGFTINLLTLFGLVLAIGLVVDDAIIVVEAVQRHIDEGDDPKEASKKAMREVGRAVVAIALVLAFVFVPSAFAGGITGDLYRQFALTIAVSILLSAFVALTLTPALCGVFLRAPEKGKGPAAWVTEHFNRVFERITAWYTDTLRKLLHRGVVVLVASLLLVAATVWLIKILPTGFVPNEDQGYFYVSLTMPDGTSLQRTDEIVRSAEAKVRTLPGVRYITTLGGYSYLEDTDESNTASLVVDLEPWSKRTGKGEDANSLMARAEKLLSDIPSASVASLSPPAIPGLGGTGGFTMELQDLKGRSISDLSRAADRFTRQAQGQKQVANIYDSFRADVPQVSIDIARNHAGTLGVPISSLADTLHILLGGLIVNDFDRFGRVYKTMIEAEPKYRMEPGQIRDVFVRTGSNQHGQMVPLSTITRMHQTEGPNVVQRFDMYRSAEISGAAASGFSSGQAIAEMERQAKKLPSWMSYQWSGVALQQKQSAGTRLPLFALSILFVFLVLAAQFESWWIPLAILFSAPAAIFGAFAGLWMRGLDDDVYAQIAVITLVGLTAKNAVLIAQFAFQRDRDRAQDDEGPDKSKAGSEENPLLAASRTRFRPILMTSFAFIFGMLPLAIAHGAGANSRHVLGTAVLGGMLAATLLQVFLTPMLLDVAVRLKRKGRQNRERKQGGKSGKPKEASA